jgi:DNA polymerase III epsilon subunit-like protein
VIFTETGGLQPRHSTIQLAACTEDGAEFNSYLRPDDGDLIIDPRAMAINGIDIRDAKDWPTASQVAHDFMDWLTATGETGPVIACGFNVHFDVERVNSLLVSAGYPEAFSHRTMDLTAVAMFHTGLQRSADIIARYGDPGLHPLHDALVDAKQARAVYRSLKAEFGS